MNSTSKFQIGNEVAKRNRGRKHKASLIKQLLADRILDLDERLFEVTSELLNSKNLKIKMFAWRALIKYRLPVKFEINSEEKKFDEIIVTVLTKNVDSQSKGIESNQKLI